MEQWSALYIAVAHHDAAAMATLATQLLAPPIPASREQHYLVAAAMLGLLQQERRGAARDLWLRHLLANYPAASLPPIGLLILASHAL